MSYFGLVTPRGYKTPEASVMHGIIDSPDKQASWITSHWTILQWVTLLFFCCDSSSFLSSGLTTLAQDRSDVVSFPHCPSLSSKSHLSKRTHDNITHSEANVFTMHWHGSVQSIITTLWLQPSHFSNNAQMYQLLLLYNENRWETGDKPWERERKFLLMKKWPW